MTEATRATPILRFTAGEAPDRSGRWLADIRAWDDDRLEQVHDYIQWLFPLPERSAFNAAAPVLSDADIAAFRRDAALRGQLLLSFRRLLAFYGFALEGGEGEDGTPPAVVPAPNAAARRAVWLTPGNHNFLRITRILRCLRLLGPEREAAAFLARLEALHDEGAGRIVGPVTLRYWREALAGDAGG